MTTTTALILKHLTVKSKSGFEWLCLCPYHEDNTPSFSVNIRKKLFICYACGAKGNMTQLLEYLGVYESPQEEEVSLDELTNKIKSVGSEISRTERPPVGFPVPARFYSSQEQIDKYWGKERKLSADAVVAYGLGYDSLSDEAIIPVRDFNGHNVGIIRRSFDPTRPRYLYSKGLKISECVFGSNEALQLAKRKQNKKGVLVITEGSVDAMTVYGMETEDSYFVGVAVLGSRISKKQAEVIKRLGYENIIVATDMDRAGKTAQIQIHTMLKDVRAGSLIHKAEWNLSSGKDLNSLSHEMLVAVLANAMDNRFDYKDFVKQTLPSLNATKLKKNAYTHNPHYKTAITYTQW